MAECVLKNNAFEHNMRFFKQLHGKTIEAKFGPQYAILFWGYLEDKILNFFIEKNSCLVALHWCYFYDSAKRGREFLKILNSCHPTIKLDAKHSLGKVKFLDVEVINSGNKLLTDLYIKHTDTHQHLEFSSCHVYRSKKSIPYSQALRFNRICSENRFFDNRCNQL